MEKLKKVQLDRVVEQINFADEDVEILCVQHRKLWQVHRLFRLKDKLLAVYDWVWSLSCEAMYFKLTQSLSRVPVSPDAPVEKFTPTISEMKIVNESIVMSKNESITFTGSQQNFKQIIETVKKKREGSFKYFTARFLDHRAVLK